MRDSRFLVILIIVSIFAIIASIFFFVRNKNQEPENIDDVVLEDDRQAGVIAEKEVTPYVAPSTSKEVATTVATEDISDAKSDESTSINVERETKEEEKEVVVTPDVPKSPEAPTLTSIPSKTDKDEEKVEVNGESGAEIFVNEWSVGKIDENGKKEIVLNTAGGDGDKSFSILLSNDMGKSGVLKVVIKKETSTTTSTSSSSSSNSSSSNSSTSSSRGEWSHMYTNEEYFDIDDYKDDDITKLKLRDVCSENKNVVSYCKKTSKLDDDFDEDELGEDKCTSSCRIGQTCLLWNNKEKSSGSLKSWVALYRCE